MAPQRSRFANLPRRIILCWRDGTGRSRVMIFPQIALWLAELCLREISITNQVVKQLARFQKPTHKEV